MSWIVKRRKEDKLLKSHGVINVECFDDDFCARKTFNIERKSNLNIGAFDKDAKVENNS